MIVLIHTYIVNKIISCAQPNPYQRSHQLDPLRATGQISHSVTSAYLAQSVWRDGAGETENPSPSLWPWLQSWADITIP